MQQTHQTKYEWIIWTRNLHSPFSISFSTVPHALHQHSKGWTFRYSNPINHCNYCGFDWCSVCPIYAREWNFWRAILSNNFPRLLTIHLIWNYEHFVCKQMISLWFNAFQDTFFHSINHRNFFFVFFFVLKFYPKTKTE